jgi:hypothetical protein
MNPNRLILQNYPKIIKLQGKNENRCPTFGKSRIIMIKKKVKGFLEKRQSRRLLHKTYIKEVSIKKF